MILRRLSSTSLSRGAIPLMLLLILNKELLGMHNWVPDLMLPIRILPFRHILGVPLTCPILCVLFCRNGKSIFANCLLDTGSGRTYLLSEVLKPLDRDSWAWLWIQFVTDSKESRQTLQGIECFQWSISFKVNNYLGISTRYLVSFQPFCGLMCVRPCDIETRTQSALSGLFGGVLSAGKWQNNRGDFHSCQLVYDHIWIQHKPVWSYLHH